MTKPKMIEKAKNLSLVVLFLSTVLLLCFFWGNFPLEQLKHSPENTNSNEINMDSLIKPEQIVINFGSDNYTVLPPEEVWYNVNAEQDSFVEELLQFGAAENILVSEITREKYQQFKEFQSIWVEFDYNIPMSDFCSKLGIKKTQNLAVIEMIQAIGYSGGDGKDGLLIYDGKNEKYYRLFAENTDGTKNSDFPALISSIEAQDHTIYYPASIYLGVDNDTLVPLAVEANLSSVPYRQDIYSYQTEKVNDLAQKFFGGNFDFVRKITEENGTIIYMYGYGQNVLIVNTDGSIEYKEEQTLDNPGQSFSGALETAVNFVESHGFWESTEDSDCSLYLKTSVHNPDKREGYRFVFGMEINGSRLYYEEGDPIIVEVTSGQVTYYKQLQQIDFDPADIAVIETPEDAFSAVNLIAQNNKYIYDILLQFGEVEATTDQDVMFEDIASLLNNMEVGYVKPAGTESTKIIPAWIVTVKDTDVFFDLYTAEPIGYCKN